MLQHNEIAEGKNLSLLTPVVKDSDVVFPGEGWFFYWKTSSSLWKQKIEELHNGSVLIVPINWSFHSETGEDVDFAENKPESDLKKLVEIAHELKKSVVFLLPITPVPFLPNGGVPHLLAKNIAKAKDGLVYTIVDSDGTLNKLYSFYNPKVFKSWSLFVRKLTEYFSQQGIASDVKALVSGYYEGDTFHSYLEDSSATFEKSFSKFILAKKEDGLEIGNYDEELILKREFSSTIANLYGDFVQETFSSNWTGFLKCAFLGGPLRDNLDRVGNSLSIESYINDFFLSMSEDIVPSTVLLPKLAKKGAFNKILCDLLDYNYQKTTYIDNYNDEDGGINLSALSFFIVANENELQNDNSLWDKYNFWEFISSEYQWCFSKKPIEEIDFTEEGVDLGKVHCFLGETLDEKSFRNALKVFMLGGQVLLDRNHLEKKLLQRLEGFLIENSLKVEKVKFHTEAHNVILGAGRLVIFDGEKLATISDDKKYDFWNKLLGTFSLIYLPIKNLDEVDFFWRTRMSGPAELNYEEVRRLGLYNPTSYKKKVIIPHAKNFALKKVIDEFEVEVHTKNSEITIEMQAGGSVSLEFGVFS